MKIDILTLFPNMFESILTTSIIKRAIEEEKVMVEVHNIRDFSTDIHKRVDDYSYGGGRGMVLKPEPIFMALDILRKDNSVVIMMTPQGKVYNQDYAYQLVKEQHLIIICGHYEGFDERIRTVVDLEISIGDYIVTGGELPSMVLIDSIIRLIDGVICEESHLKESFNNNLLDYPVYTKPQKFRGMEVPDVLLSGHHENILKWREKESLERTKKRRSDLLGKE